MPTLEGGLRIDVESATDWLVLEQIPSDALTGGPDLLPERLGTLMDDKANWDDLVIPELKEFFSGQLLLVADAITEAQREAETAGGAPEGQVFIARSEGDEWYGALNQARLALEAHFQFGPMAEVEMPETFSDIKRSAFIRSQFYCALQSVLLEHVLD